MLPVIGITTYGPSEHALSTALYDRLTITPTLYVESVRRAGAIAVLLPPDEHLYPGVLDRLDGIVFTGGTDIDPALYGGNQAHPEIKVLDPARDAAEHDGMRAAIARDDMPILCICRGMQVLNVACGGSLTEHVADLGNGDIHRDEVGGWALHDISVEPSSALAAAMQADKVNTTSGHHQAVRDLGTGLSVTARAPDGVVEAVEYTDHSWCVAVQWHPEITTDRDPTQQNLFDELVRRAVRPG